MTELNLKAGSESFSYKFPDDVSGLPIKKVGIITGDPNLYPQTQLSKPTQIMAGSMVEYVMTKDGYLYTRSPIIRFDLEQNIWKINIEITNVNTGEKNVLKPEPIHHIPGNAILEFEFRNEKDLKTGKIFKP